ncbi:MAG: hypothetical protein CR994_00650 [Maribacter sp.]|nr:MAG: hypothetical protein CR994_00650 [Maribacter sp.]
MQQRVVIGEYSITELGDPDTVGAIGPIDGFARYVSIAPSPLSGRGGNSNKYSIDGMQENGVDLSNYHEVMDYLGMDCWILTFQT